MYVIIATIIFFALSMPASALVVGTEGNVYEISEADLMEEIQRRSAAVDVEELEKKWQEKVRKQVKTYRPQDAVSDLLPASKSELYRVDVTYRLPFDVTDYMGNVLYPKGYEFNPLQIMLDRGVSMTTAMAVVNAERPEELEWFKSNYGDNARIGLLITNGYAYDLGLKLKRPVYYLPKAAVARFRLKATPSLVFQPTGQPFIAVKTFSLPTLAEKEAMQRESEESDPGAALEETVQQESEADVEPPRFRIDQPE